MIFAKIRIFSNISYITIEEYIQEFSSCEQLEDYILSNSNYYVSYSYEILR